MLSMTVNRATAGLGFWDSPSASDEQPMLTGERWSQNITNLTCSQRENTGELEESSTTNEEQ
jgi:hypothetical protein